VLPIVIKFVIFFVGVRKDFDQKKRKKRRRRRRASFLLFFAVQSVNLVQS